MDQQTSCLFNENQELRYKIVDLREKILEFENRIKQNEKIIWKNCKHEWEYDTCSGMYDKTTYFCKHCKLWKNHY